MDAHCVQMQTTDHRRSTNADALTNCYDAVQQIIERSHSVGTAAPRQFFDDPGLLSRRDSRNR